jgi:hypothetical protein
MNVSKHTGGNTTNLHTSRMYEAIIEIVITLNQTSIHMLIIITT